ncbi:MAG: YdcF family protein [Clostridiales bacterium]|nr:YdcF family protein [Clostridiales bacterium]
MNALAKHWPLGQAGALLLLAAGGYLLYTGGRPWLFGTLVLWGLATLLALLTVAAVLPPRRRKWLLRAVAAGVLALCVLFGGLEAMIYANSDSQISGEPEVMVVLGAKLWNHEPSPVLTGRLDAALDYLDDHPDMTVVVTGGMGDDEPVSEASCMADYLVEGGFPREQIMLEESATNTLENLLYSARLLQNQGYSTENLLVVSNGAHVARVKLLARRIGLDISTLSTPVPGGIFYKTYFRAREGAALVKSWLFDKGTI